jgi:peptidoglycan/LPS O-acetylase OafA/YrhL
MRARLSPQRLALGLTIIAFVVGEVYARGGELGGPPLDYYQPQAHAFGLLLGCWLSVTPTPRWIRHATLPAIAGLVLMAAFAPDGYHVSYLRYSIPAACLLTAVLLAALEHDTGPVAAGLAWGPIRRLGVISYGLYLYDQLVIDLVAHYVHPHPSITYNEYRVIALVASVLVAELSYRYYEAPIRRLGRRFGHQEPVAAGR